MLSILPSGKGYKDTHREKQSMITNMQLFPDVLMGSGPIRSMLILVNGCDAAMVYLWV